MNIKNGIVFIITFLFVIMGCVSENSNKTVINNTVVPKLKALTLYTNNGSEILISPSFSKDKVSYTAEVSENVEQLNVTALPETSDLSINAEKQYSLSQGENTISVEVISSDKKSRTLYTIIVTRDGKVDNTTDGGIEIPYLKSLIIYDATGTALNFSPQFIPTVKKYSLTVNNSVASIKIDARTSTAGLTIIGASAYALNEGENNITLEVYNTNNKKSNIYTIVITREKKEVITSKFNENDINVYVTDSLSGSLVDGADVKVYSGTKIIVEGKTNKSGVFVIESGKLPLSETLNLISSKDGRATGKLQDYYVARDAKSISLYSFIKEVPFYSSEAPTITNVRFTSDAKQYDALMNGETYDIAKVKYIEITVKGKSAIEPKDFSGYPLGISFNKAAHGKEIIKPTNLIDRSVIDGDYYRTKAVFDLTKYEFIEGENYIDIVSYDMANNRVEKKINFFIKGAYKDTVDFTEVVPQITEFTVNRLSKMPGNFSIKRGFPQFSEYASTGVVNLGIDVKSRWYLQTRGIIVYRSDDGKSYEEVGKLDYGKLETQSSNMLIHSYTDRSSTFELNKNYYYKVKAFNNTTISKYSEPVIVSFLPSFSVNLVSPATNATVNEAPILSFTTTDFQAMMDKSDEFSFAIDITRKDERLSGSVTILYDIKKDKFYEVVESAKNEITYVYKQGNAIYIKSENIIDYTAGCSYEWNILGELKSEMAPKFVKYSNSDSKKKTVVYSNYQFGDGAENGYFTFSIAPNAKITTNSIKESNYYRAISEEQLKRDTRYGYIIVKTEKSFDRSYFLNNKEEIVDSMAFTNSNYYLIYVSENILQTIETIKKVKGVLFAYPELKSQIVSAGFKSNDLYVNSAQYSTDITYLKEAWNEFGFGNTKPYVVVVDTGINAEHPEFDNVFYKGYTFFQKNSSGFYSYIGDNNQPIEFIKGNYDNENFSGSGHGTHVSGIIGARGDNGIGTAGVCWNVNLILYKVAQGNQGKEMSESFGDWTIYGALKHVVDWKLKNNIKQTIPVNMSLGGGSTSPFEEDMVKYGLENNVVVIASMGNSGSNNINYPAAINGVIAVGATDGADKKTTFSTSGRYISVCAPGQDIISTGNKNNTDYVLMSGTSMSAPFVTGTVAYMLTFNPTLPPSDIKAILEQNADNLGVSGFDEDYGFGRVNVYKTIKSVVNNEPFERTYSSKSLNVTINLADFNESFEDNADTTITVYDSNNNFVCQGLPNEFGKSGFAMLRKGTYKIVVNRKGIVQIKENIEVSDSEINIFFNY